jgi:hypothetical protein
MCDGNCESISGLTKKEALKNSGFSDSEITKLLNFGGKPSPYTCVKGVIVQKNFEDLV